MYTAYRINTPLTADGRLLSSAWQHAPKSPAFVDMASGDPAIYSTQAAVLWDDDNLYVGFWVEDPYPKAVQTERDSIIFRENDIELFIDGGDCYYEFEVNALGTIYEVFFIWRDAYKRGSRFDVPEFDLLERAAFSFAGDFDRTQDHFWWGTHPRGPRWAFLDWDLPGLVAHVNVDGNLNNNEKRSLGWTVEMVIPWKGLEHLADGRSLPPQNGDVWKLFFGRFQNLFATQGKAQAAWCWTPHGVYDTHLPDKFTPITFSSLTVEEAGKTG